MIGLIEYDYRTKYIFILCQLFFNYFLIDSLKFIYKHKVYFNSNQRGDMPKKKTNIAALVESDIWNRTTGYSKFMKIKPGEVITRALNHFFKTIDEIEKNIDKEKGD